LRLQKPTLVEGWKKLWKSYSVIFSLANILQAISVSALSILGVINVYFAFKVVIGLAILFGLLGLAGRLLRQGVLVKDPDVENTDVQ
jgi:hypothetical protein